MSDLAVVLAVAYAGLCVGTFINVNDLNGSVISKLCIAVFAPIPVFLMLAWMATSIAIERFRTLKESSGYPLLLALSLAMYPEAIKILVSTDKSSKRTIVHGYKHKVPIIRKTIATSYVAA